MLEGVCEGELPGTFGQRDHEGHDEDCEHGLEGDRDSPGRTARRKVKAKLKNVLKVSASILSQSSFVSSRLSTVNA